MNSYKTSAQILESSDDNIKKCADYLLGGGIVGMPTETVYGLAANAFDVDAVKKIFEYKGRPLSDPLIVHVTSVEMANKLINIDTSTDRVFRLLSNKFWPGPLTIVLKANFNVISPILTASTEFIGIRYPKNEIAQKLINVSGVPIAAPSANKFCHVSPVNPLHVYDDFKEFPVMILDGGVCNFCMESTVIKLTENKIQILRTGAISYYELHNFIKENNLLDFTVEVYKKIIPVPLTIEENIKEINQESPGQFIKHYSPQLDTYIFDKNVDTFSQIKPTEMIVVDYKNILYKYFNNKIPKENYLELSIQGDANEVMKNLYDYLRLAENLPQGKMILLCDIDSHMEENEHKHTLVDRINKAAAFRRININV